MWAGTKTVIFVRDEWKNCEDKFLKSQHFSSTSREDLVFLYDSPLNFFYVFQILISSSEFEYYCQVTSKIPWFASKLYFLKIYGLSNYIQ